MSGAACRVADPIERVAEALGGGDLRFFRAPGRVNLMGDHTDYNEGFVLPAAIDRECVIGFRRREDRTVRLRSLDLGEPSLEIVADGGNDPARVEPSWARGAAGVLRALAARGRRPAGFDAALTSTVPIGSGLSSSAALEVAVALAALSAADYDLETEDVAVACRDAERLATGVPCGVMDPLASLAGRSGHALAIDCRTLAIRPVAMPSELALLVVHSGLPRRLADSAYAERRADCERVARSLGLAALRDATPEQVKDEPRARHVVAESARVAETAAALGERDVETLRKLFAASHASLRDDFGVSTPELDALVAALLAAGAIAARLTGAGFGGSVVALVERDSLDGVAEDACRRYAAETGRTPTPIPCRATAGAGPIRGKARIAAPGQVT